jgi:uncharacterized repeat protein (TIGR01451 family)
MKRRKRDLVLATLTSLFLVGALAVGSLAADENWSPAGDLTLERNSHVATVLSDGRVLVTGGYSPSAGNGGYNVQTVEIYDPATNSWSTTGSTANGRNDHAAVRLANGKVLVAGGVNANICASDTSAELYDPVTGTWSFTGSIPFATTGLTMTVMSDGKVLLAGGGNRCGGVFSAAAVYDPTAGTWSPTGSMTLGREWHSAVLLPNGRVLVAGGLGSSSPFPSLSSAEIYDPATGTWSITASMATTRFGSVTPFLTRLSDGRVMAAAGSSGNGFGSSPNGPQVEIYDPATGTWSPTGSMSVGRAGGTFSLLDSGKILAAGGSDATPATHSSAELYNPVTGTWSTTASLLTARASHAAAVLADGRVLAVAGYDGGNYFTSAEVYGPAVFTANLGIVKTDPPTRAPTGQNRTYTITVTNSGPETAYGVTVTDTLPGSVTFVSATPSQGSCVRSGVIVTCYLGSIASGGNATVSLVVKPTVAGVITNVASVTTSSTDPEGGNNSDSENTTVCRITSRPTSIPCP